MEITIFRNVTGRQGDALVSLRDLSQCITDGVISGTDYRNVIAGIRKAVAEGRSEEVRLLKMQLPALAFAGNCMKGRFYPNTTNRTGLAMFDIDKISAGQVEMAKKQLKFYPRVALIYTTCSGVGSEDVYSAVDYICTLAAGNGMNRPEIKSAVTWGYANGSEAPKDNILGAGTGFDYQNRVKKVNNDPILDEKSTENGPTGAQKAVSADDDDIFSDEIETENEVICRLCPTIPDDVFESLPCFIKEIALNSRTIREILFYLLPTLYEWVSPAPRGKSGESDFDSMMRVKAMRLKEYFFKYNDTIVVEFTDEQ